MRSVHSGGKDNEMGEEKKQKAINVLSKETAEDSMIEEAAAEVIPADYPEERKKHRSEKEQRDLVNRLKRIEGQVRGIRGMVEKEMYCPDILTQVAAVNAALNSFNKVLLGSHVKTCVAENIRQGNDEVIDELVILLQKLMK